MKLWRPATLGCLVPALLAATLSAVDLDVNRPDIEGAMKIARGAEAGRSAFHEPYLFAAGDPIVERIEVVTELRRLVLFAEDHIRGGDPWFAQGALRAEEAIRPWRRRVSIVARLVFPPDHKYMILPPLDITLVGPSGNVPRLGMRNETQFGPGLGDVNWSPPIVGNVGDALFDARAIGQSIRTAVVRMDNQELARVTIDFSRLD